MSQYQATIELADLDGSNGFRIDGHGIWAHAGRSVASVDLNGDGFGDVVVGAPEALGYSGTSSVIWGHAGKFAAVINLDKLDGDNGVQFQGRGEEVAGVSVSSAGDVNGDGFEDLLVGAPAAGEHGKNSGHAYVVFGGARDFGAHQYLPGAGGGFSIVGEGPGDYVGDEVSAAGDINRDGFDDLIVSGNGDGNGVSYVVFGKASGFGSSLDLSTLNGANGFKVIGEHPGDYLGLSTASLDDVNGDGFGDLVLGATAADPGGAGSGAAYVIFGKASGFDAQVNLSSLDGATGFVIDGQAAGDSFGRVSSAGDVNGDGIADILASARDSDANGSNSGAAYVVFGHKGGFDSQLDLASLDGSNGFEIVGGAGARLGYSVAAAGDVNGDGFDDVIVGAADAGPGGASYVIFGKAGGFDAIIDAGSLDGSNGFRIDGVASGDVAAIVSSGDVNGDGLSDLIIGAPGADPHGRLSGSSYVVFGVLPDSAVERVGTVASQTLVGGNVDDRLQGLGGDDQLWGNGGADKLVGGQGADTLRGGDGDDVLSGGHGRDLLVGGAGANSFVFTSVADSAAAKADTIADLHKGDVMDLSRIDADATQVGDQAFVRVAAFSGHAGELVVSFEAASGMTDFAGDVDGDGQADLLIRASGLHDHFAGLVL